MNVRLESMIPEDNLEEDEDDAIVSARMVKLEPKENNDYNEAFGNISSNIENVGMIESSKIELQAIKKN